MAWCRRWRQAGVPWAGLGLAGAWGDPAGALGNCPRRACPSRAGGSPSCRCSRRAWLSSLSSRWRSSKGWSRWANLRSKMRGNSTINCSSSASWPRLCSSSWRAAARAAASSGDGAWAGLGVLLIPGDGLFAGGGCSAGDGCSTGESWSTGEGWSVGDGCSRGPGTGTRPIFARSGTLWKLTGQRLGRPRANRQPRRRHGWQGRGVRAAQFQQRAPRQAKQKPLNRSKRPRGRQRR